MTAVRGDIVLAGVISGGKAMARWQRGAKFLQIYAPGRMFWSKKAIISRNAPFTIESPHLGQIQVRIQFGELAKTVKGQHGFRNGLPLAAATIQERLKGYKAPDRMAPEEYPSKHFHTIHTLEELKRMERELRAKARAYPATPPAGVPPI